MASFKKLGNSWRASINRKVNGVSLRPTAVFSTKAEAQAWAAQIESEIIAGKQGKAPNKTFGDLLDRYAREVSKDKKGRRWEEIRINALKAMSISSVKLDKLSEVHISEWRNERLKLVSSETVRREWNLISSACNIASKEWKWLKFNPMKDVKRPESAKARTRRISDGEIEKILFTCGWDGQSKPATAQALVALLFCLAIETGMRAGEMLSLGWKNVDLKKQTAHLPETKNGHPRTVPLSKEAVRLLSLVKSKKDQVFEISSSNLDALFRKCRDKALIKDLHFHDTRREALSRLSKKLDPFQLAKMSGHRDMRMLLNVYYQEDASVTAKLLG
jgi:integrase